MEFLKLINLLKKRIEPNKDEAEQENSLAEH